jgi:hypothetical protein
MKTAFGWLVLLGALAIPAVLFWKWWIAMQTTTTFEVKQKPPEAQTAFGEVKSAQENPIETAATDPQAVQAQAQAAGTAEDSLDQAPDLTASAAAPEAGEAPPVDAPGERSGADAPPEQAAAPEAVPPGAEDGRLRYAPKSSRDPMVSIFDLRELAKRRLAKEMARREVKKALQPPKPPPKKRVRRAPPKPKPKPFCETLELQGIIATPNGIAAIIDDEVRNEGDIYKGAVIARITTRTVIFKKRRRTVCVKRVQR